MNFVNVCCNVIRFSNTISEFMSHLIHAHIKYNFKPVTTMVVNTCSIYFRLDVLAALSDDLLRISQ